MWDTWTGKHKTQLYHCPHTADWTKQGFTRDKNIREEQAIYSKRHRAVIRRPLKTEKTRKDQIWKGDPQKDNFKQQANLHSMKKCSATLSHLNSDKNHSTKLNCEARQSNKFTGMNTAQGGTRGCFCCFLYYFYLSASKCLTQSSQQALQPDAVDHFILIPWAHSNTEHILDERRQQ